MTIKNVLSSQNTYSGTSTVAGWSDIIDLILDYYNNFRIGITPGPVTPDWHRLCKGIVTRCTISVTLFSLTMTMVVKDAEMERRGPLTKSCVQQPPVRDDLTITIAYVPGSRWILQGLEKVIS